MNKASDCRSEGGSVDCESDVSEEVSEVRSIKAESRESEKEAKMSSL